MAKEKRRLSKNAKAALKVVNESKLLAAAKAAVTANAGQELRGAQVTPSTAVAKRLRPEKKRG